MTLQIWKNSESACNFWVDNFFKKILEHQFHDVGKVTLKCFHLDCRMLEFFKYSTPEPSRKEQLLTLSHFWILVWHHKYIAQLVSINKIQGSQYELSTVWQCLFHKVIKLSVKCPMIILKTPPLNWKFQANSKNNKNFAILAQDMCP